MDTAGDARQRVNTDASRRRGHSNYGGKWYPGRGERPTTLTFSGVTKCGSASLGGVGVGTTGDDGRAGPYIQECRLAANANLHTRPLLAVVEEVWCFWGCAESGSTDDVQPDAPWAVAPVTRSGT